MSAPTEGTPVETPTLGARARRLARLVSLAGIGMFWVVLLALYVVAGVPFLDAILLAVLLVLAPSLAIAQVPLVEGATIDRVSAYVGSIATLCVLGGLCWLVGTRAEGPTAVGAVGVPLVSLFSWSAGLTATALLLVWIFYVFARWARVPETRILGELLPRTGRERRLFAVLSVAAGTGEELAYRGYAIPVLAPLIGVPWAAVLTTLIFGLLHSYQGWLGIVRTSLMGGVLAWGFLAAGSLWPAIIAHTAIDLLTGLVFGERLLQRGGRRRVAQGGAAASERPAGHGAEQSGGRGVRGAPEADPDRPGIG